MSEGFVHPLTRKYINLTDEDVDRINKLKLSGQGITTIKAYEMIRKQRQLGEF